MPARRMCSLDDERGLQLMTPRKPKSGWSRPNKERVKKLLDAGLIRIVEAIGGDRAGPLLLDPHRDEVAPSFWQAAHEHLAHRALLMPALVEVRSEHGELIEIGVQRERRLRYVPMVESIDDVRHKRHPSRSRARP